MFAFDLVWPYMGLGMALLLALLLFTDALRSDLSVSRWQDLVWLAWAGMLAYLIHQFEEHGIDAQGAVYAFRSDACRNFGFSDIHACPIPFSFITAVNISAVWLFGPATALLGRRRPELALAFFAIP
ncbi:MAG: HXXEE domain-containing protein, partial [Solimonas sp.]